MTIYRFDTEKASLVPYRSVAWGENYTEEHLETWLEQNPDVVTDGEPILIIARQPPTPSGTPDLVGLDADGNTVIIELKRGRTPRDVVAQALEYAAWIDGLDQEGVIAVAAGYFAKRHPSPDEGRARTLAQAWREAFAPEAAETVVGEAESDAVHTLPAGVRLNDQQRIILVLEGGDERTATVVRYLRRQGVDITLVEYRFYRIEGGEEILDVQMRVGREQPAGGDVAEQPSEQKLLASWPNEARAPYIAFRNTLLERDSTITAEPKKTAVSFYKRTRDGRVYLGSYGGTSRQHADYWFRNDSLADHLDLPALVATLDERAPDGVIFSDEWKNHYNFRMPFSLSHARQVAELVAAEIAGRIE